MTEISLNLITSVLFTCFAVINVNKVFYKKYYCMWMDELDYIFYLFGRELKVLVGSSR